MSTGPGPIVAGYCAACCGGWQWLASRAAAGAVWEGVRTGAVPGRQIDWQAGTPVAEIEGSSQDAYSGSSRMIRFRGRRSGGGGGGRGHLPATATDLTGSCGKPPRPSKRRCFARVHSAATSSLLASRQAPSPAMPCPATSTAYMYVTTIVCLRAARWKDDHRYTIWPALLTPAASIGAAKPSKGPGADQRCDVPQ